MTEDQAREIIRCLHDIKLSLEGNTKLGIEGAFKILKRHDDWIRKMNLRMAMWAGAGAASGVAGLPIAKSIWHAVFGTH